MVLERAVRCQSRKPLLSTAAHIVSLTNEHVRQTRARLFQQAAEFGTAGTATAQDRLDTEMPSVPYVFIKTTSEGVKLHNTTLVLQATQNRAHLVGLITQLRHNDTIQRPRQRIDIVAAQQQQLVQQCELTLSAASNSLGWHVCLDKSSQPLESMTAVNMTNPAVCKVV